MNRYAISVTVLKITEEVHEIEVDAADMDGARMVAQFTSYDDTTLDKTKDSSRQVQNTSDLKPRRIVYSPSQPPDGVLTP